MTISTTRASTIKKTAGLLISIIFWIGVWQIAAVSVGKELLLPSPVSVVRSLINMFAEKGFWQSSVYSLLRVFGGFAAGVLTGSLLAVLTSVSWVCDFLFSPVIRIIRATPVASFIILAMLWIGSPMVPALMSMLMVIPIVWASLRTSFSETSKSLLELSRIYRFGLFKTIRYIYYPSLKPAFISSCITSMGLAWKSGIAAEVLSLPRRAIGTNLYYSKVYLETSSLFAWTAVIVLLSFFLEKGIALLLQRRTAK